MLDFLIGALTVWRLTALLTTEDGPFSLIAYFRDAIGVRFDEHSRPYGRNEVAKAFLCFKCTSFWLGLTISALQGHTMLDGFLTGLAYSGATILLERLAAK